MKSFIEDPTNIYSSVLPYHNVEMMNNPFLQIPGAMLEAGLPDYRAMTQAKPVL